jgi:hypothetical protein
VKGRNVHPGGVMWNIESSDVKGDFERLKAAGAAVVQEPYQPDEGSEGWIATFSDPDDNDVQLVSPMELNREGALAGTEASLETADTQSHYAARTSRSLRSALNVRRHR